MTRRVSRRGFIKLAAAVGISTGAGASAREVEWRVRARGAGAEANPFVLVHGMWHGAWCWYKIAAALRLSGRQVTAIDLPGAGIDPTPPGAVTRQAQVDRLTALLDTIRDPVILVGHSAGGPVVSEAAEARPERIAKLVYLSAFLVPNGVSPTQITIGDRGSTLGPNLVAVPGLGAFDVRASARPGIFYNECRERDLALAEALFRPASLLPMVPPMSLGDGFASVRRFYISCLRDNAVSPAAQQEMYTALPCERVLTIAGSDHSPFFSRTQALLRALLEIERA